MAGVPPAAPGASATGPRRLWRTPPAPAGPLRRTFLQVGRVCCAPASAFWNIDGRTLDTAARVDDASYQDDVALHGLFAEGQTGVTPCDLRQTRRRTLSCARSIPASPSAYPMTRQPLHRNRARQWNTLEQAVHKWPGPASIRHAGCRPQPARCVSRQTKAGPPDVRLKQTNPLGRRRRRRQAAYGRAYQGPTQGQQRIPAGWRAVASAELMAIVSRLKPE